MSLLNFPVTDSTGQLSTRDHLRRLENIHPLLDPRTIRHTATDILYELTCQIRTWLIRALEEEDYHTALECIAEAW